MSHFDVEMPKMAHVMAICGDLKGPESENVENPLVLQWFLHMEPSKIGSDPNLTRI